MAGPVFYFRFLFVPCLILYAPQCHFSALGSFVSILYLVSTRYSLVLYLPVLFSLAQDFLYIGLSKAKELISPFLTQNTTLNHSLQVYLEAKLLQGGLYRTTSNSCRAMSRLQDYIHNHFQTTLGQH